MPARIPAALVLAAALAYAQGGTEPKPKPEDYEAHGSGKAASLGAEFLIHSFSGRGQMYIADDYLVVEVALYPPKGEAVEVNAGQFTLRVNGKRPLLTVPASMVAGSFQHPEWQPRLEGSVGAGPADVIFGRPRPSTDPGNPVPGRRPPRAPDDDPPGGIEREARVKPEELVVETALPTGRYSGAVSGYLYFPYKGKASGIKTVELVYDGATIKLR
jgi:hypothetical protein